MYGCREAICDGCAWPDDPATGFLFLVAVQDFV